MSQAFLFPAFCLLAVFRMKCTIFFWLFGFGSGIFESCQKYSMPPILFTLFAFLILLDLRIPFPPSTIFGLFSSTSILNSTTPLFIEFGLFCGDPVGVWSGSLLVRCCASSVLQLTGGRISGVWLFSDLATVSSVLYFMSAVTVISVSVFSVSGGSSAWDD